MHYEACVGIRVLLFPLTVVGGPVWGRCYDVSPPNGLLNCGLIGIQVVENECAVLVLIDVWHFEDRFLWRPYGVPNVQKVSAHLMRLSA